MICSRGVRFTAWTMGVACLLSFSSVVRAETFGIAIGQAGQRDGSIRYNLFVSNQSFYSNPMTLFGPDGTPYTNQQPYSVAVAAADVNTRIVGRWTVQGEPSATSPLGSRYEFTMPTLPNHIPTITSPADGAVVGADFRIDWTVPAGAVRTATGYWYSNPGLPSPSLLDLLSQNAVLLHFDMAGHEAGAFSFYTSHEENLVPTRYIAPIGSTTIDPSRDPTVGVYAGFASAPITLTVIPEPSGLVLAALGLIGGAAWAWRRQA